MINAENLTKFYGDRAAVRDMTFEVEKGEIVGLLGPNGAGKTTTMRMLTGYLPADGGRAIVAGYNVADKPMEVRKRLGYLPETVPLYTEMPVDTYLDFTAKIRGVPANGRRRRIEEVMELCRIADVKHKIIGKLSRGYRQRVGLAQAIVHNPQVIILDEPTVGLDPRQIIEIRKVIRDLSGNHSMILSTHILPEVSALCDRVVIVNRGRVLVEDTLANLERRGEQGERLRVEVRGPAEEVENFLRTWPGVLQVEATVVQLGTSVAADQVMAPSDTPRFDVKLQPGNDVREALAGAIFRQGWGLLELRTVAPSLEEIFVQLITEDLAQFEDEAAIPSITDELDEPVALETQAKDVKLSSGDDELDEPEDLEMEAAPVKPEPRLMPLKKRAVTVRKRAPSFLNDSNLDPSKEPAGDPAEEDSSSGGH